MTEGALNRSYIYKATGQVHTLTGPLIGGDGIFANGFQASPPATTTFSYDPFNRLSQISGPNVTASYKVVATGLRVEKTAQGQTTRFVYGLDGQLLSEHAITGNQRSQHLYLNGQPVALVRGGQMYAVMPDHLGRPELLVDQSNQVVWRAELTAFERRPFIDALGGYHLGFPGQYHDTETGFAYNVMRDYDPATGRYLQSDPIGLAGGINTYGYAEGNPVMLVDSIGLCADEFPASPFGGFRSLNPNQVVVDLGRDLFEPMGDSAKAATIEVLDSAADFGECAAEEALKQVRNEIIERGAVSMLSKVVGPKLGLPATLLYASWNRSIYSMSYESYVIGSAIGMCIAGPTER